MTSPRPVADGITCGDLLHLGRAEAIATYLMESSDGLVAQARADELGIRHFALSLSHTHQHAIAFVVGTA